mmetsp:Transcript_67497/g.187117  ORF Transcript_67497/g.187117 Transcript_67497/m.187117 type:complete len:259 (-) Transcript_67497:55-831(-)
MPQPERLANLAGEGVVEPHLLPFLWPRDLLRFQAASLEFHQRATASGALRLWTAGWRRWQPHSLHQAAEVGDTQGVWAGLRAPEAWDHAPLRGAEAPGPRLGRMGPLPLSAPVNARDRYGLTPLQYAALHGHETAVRLLLAALADPQARYFAVNLRNGAYALHLASHRGSIGCVRALLGARCDIDAVDGGCRTALSYAQNAGRHEVAAVLVACRAKPDVEILADERRIVEAALADDGSPRSCCLAWDSRRAVQGSDPS